MDCVELLEDRAEKQGADAPRSPQATAAPLRVCFFIDRLSKAGTESQLLALIRHLDRRNVEPFLCLLDGEDAESRALEPADCPVLRLGVRSLRRPSTLVQAVRFGRFLRRNRIDVAQFYFPDSTYFGVTVARLAGVRRVLRTRFNTGYWMTPLHLWLGRLHSKLVDGTVTNCEACRQSIIAAEWPAPESVWIVENGVEFDRFADVPPLTGSAGAVRRVGLVANLRPVKDPAAFVQAAGKLAADFPDATFHIAGEGELRPQLESLVARLGLVGRVVLEGAVADVPGFLAGLEVAVLCSRSEGLSNAILEYMAAGRAVVATAVGGTAQLIDDGVHGLLVPPNNPTELAQAVRRLLADPTLAARLGAAARARTRERYDAAVRARRFEEFYDGLVRPRRAA